MAAAIAEPRTSAVPPLEVGEQLSRTEFHRRYLAMPAGQKWELIEGVAYMASPMRAKGHGRKHALLMTTLGQYFARTPGVEFQDNTTSILDDDNEPQPDATLLVEPECGGQTRDDADGYSVGAPEFIAEIAGSSKSIDLGPKLRAYRRNRVQEYLVWRTADRAFDWHRWRDGAYVKLEPDALGIVRSEIMPGLWLNLPALIRRDRTGAIATVVAGLASPEHAAFVAELVRRKGSA